MNFDQLKAILSSLPDPVFLLTKSGKYIEAFGGKDSRYYPNAKELVGHNFNDLVDSETARWALSQIELALETRRLVIVEYELSKKDLNVLSDVGPDESIWFEGRIQALDFKIDEEELVLWVASNISDRHALEEQLVKMSDTDQLTGLYNRRKLENELQLFLETFKRHSIPTSLLMFDVDNLKIINDSLGHIAGDKLIKTVASTFINQLRVNDIACRFGGDEFVIALPSTHSDQALKLAQRIHESALIDLSKFCVEEAKASLSIGVTTMLATDLNYVDTLKRADQALYLAKNMGKNKIVVK